jgi:hypothetical protein
VPSALLLERLVVSENQNWLSHPQASHRLFQPKFVGHELIHYRHVYWSHLEEHCTIVAHCRTVYAENPT